MSWDIVTIIATAAATLLTAVPVGVWVGVRLVRAKYQTEIDALRAEVRQKLAEAKSQELENVRKAAAILMENIVPPLEEKIGKLNEEVEKLTSLLELIWNCPHIDHCPVRSGLLPPKASCDGQPDGTAGAGHGDRAHRQPKRGKARGDSEPADGGCDGDGD